MEISQFLPSISLETLGLIGIAGYFGVTKGLPLLKKKSSSDASDLKALRQLEMRGGNEDWGKGIELLCANFLMSSDDDEI